MLRRRTQLACWICLAAASVFFSLVLASHARAEWPPDESQGPINYSDPKYWPNDPGYQGSWELWSFLPASVANKPGVSAQNKRLGSGTHTDRAWAKTIGDRRVLISVLDSGIEWEQDDLLAKWHLNAAELPVPDNGCPATGMGKDPHDVNGDGIVNIQDYATTKGHEFTTFDKACDTRVKAKGDVNKNGVLDPEDLIAAFSDGKDDDNNGYVDDISGWDFFHNDNDPYDDTRYGHGTGESRDSSAEGGNMRGDIGTCPECSVQILRVGDSFVTDANMFGMAVLYATDNGSSVVQEALGTLSNSYFSKQAMDYAYKNGVTIIASAADEDSFHHNMPGTNNHTFYVHAITYDTEGNFRGANTFLNFNNCTNYGAQLVASVSGSACSSEATGKLAGVAGLVYAAALKADVKAPAGAPFAGDPDGNRRLTTEEVYQILKTTVDDLYDPADATDPTKYPTKVGWDQRFGYGRINARGAVDAVFGGKIPPEVDIRGPEWFEVIFPDRTPKVKIDGRIQINRALPGDTFDWVLEYATGVEPEDKEWKTIAMGNAIGQALDGAIADWDVSQLKVENPSQGSPDNLTNRRLVTLRLRATIHSTDKNRDGTKGEMRRAVHIERDPDLLPGWPIHLKASGEMNGKMADLLGDGKRELVIADADGYVHAFKIDGTELAGWPVRTNLLPTVDPTHPGGSHTASIAFTKGGLNKDLHSGGGFAAAVGDLDGDKKPEVIVGTYDGYVFAWRADGTIVPGWPFSVDRSTVTQTTPRRIMYEGVLAAPVLADMNKDGKLDVIVATMNSLVYVLGADGKPLSGWNGGKPLVVQDPSLSENTDPKQLRDRIVSTPAIGDLTGDGVPDIVLGTNENYDNQGRLYAIDGASAQYLPGWPISVVTNYVLPLVGSGMPNAPAMADLDGDKIPEIVVGGIAGGARTYNSKGKQFGRIYPNSSNSYGPMSDAKNAVSIVLMASPAIGDLDDDGVLDVVQPTGGGDAAAAFASGGIRRDFEHHVAAWDTKTGEFKPGFPRVIEDWQFFNSAVIADIDGDGKSEAIEASAGYWVHAWRADGTEPTGFPKLTGGWVTQSVAIGDMDGDGKLELAVGTRDGWLFGWRAQGKQTGRIDWASFHHDLMNTGNYDTALDIGTKAMPKTEMPDVKGCQCGVGGRTGGAWGMVIAVGLVALVIRRRRRA